MKVPTAWRHMEPLSVVHDSPEDERRPPLLGGRVEARIRSAAAQARPRDHRAGSDGLGWRRVEFRKLQGSVA